MNSEIGKWYSLLWQPINFDDKEAFNQLKNCPKFFYVDEPIVNLKQHLESMWNCLYLVEIYKTAIFIEDKPTHYRVGKMMPNDNKRYDEWLLEYHSKTEKILDELTRRREIYQSKIFIEYSNKILRHDMHSGINTYMPRGMKLLKERLPDSVIREHKLGPAMLFLEKGLSHTQMVYKGVYSFTGLVKQKKQIDMSLFSLKKELEKYLEMTTYADKVEVSELPQIEGNASLICTAFNMLIHNGLTYNKSKDPLVKIYSDGDAILVEDNGVGLTQNEFNVITFPKKDNIISGMGLNIALVIFQEHGYSIEVIPAEISGTIIKIKQKSFI